MTLMTQTFKARQKPATQTFVERTPVIQTKLNIGKSNDKFEQEADTMADKVIGMSNMQVHKETQTRALVQRKCSACSQEEEIQKKSIADKITPLIQMSRTDSGGKGIASTSLTQQINSSKGGGHSMDRGTSGFMENRFGTDFSAVKIHTDSTAIQLSRDLDAQAFTVGNDVYFNEGKYNPSSTSGKHLLAHELTHTIQQKGTKGIQRFASCGTAESCPSRDTGERTRARTGSMVAVPRIGGETGIVVTNFDVNSASIKSTLEHSPTWSFFTSKMGTHTNLTFEVLGFTDCQGDESLNLDLRARRAEAVYSALPTAAQSRISRRHAAPIEDCAYSNSSEFGRKTNRSAVIRLIESTYDFEDESVEGDPCANQTFTGLSCDDPTFCTPYASRAEIRAAKSYLLGTFVPLLEGYFGSEVGDLWRRYLSRKRGDSLRPVVFDSSSSSIYRSFSWNNQIIDEVDNVLDLIASRLGRGYGNVTQPLNNFISNSEKRLFTNFSNPFTIPGNIAGGISGSDAGRDSRRITWGRVSFDITELPFGNKMVEIEAFVNFEVKDAIDFCPGGCGAILEQSLATIQMSRLEASCEAYDTPYVVRFPGPRRTKTVFD